MFERFTDRARRVVVLAQEEARLLEHNYIGTEHILLALIHETDGIAAEALRELGISLDAVRSQVQQLIGRGQGSPSGHVPFTPRAKKVLELSLREALQFGHNYIGTEHILLGLVREGEGVGARVLVELGADLASVREKVVSLLGDPVKTEPGGSPTSVAVLASPPQEDMPVCHRCGASLASVLSWKTISAAGPEGEAVDIRVAYCGRCGRALGAHSALPG
ncbi:MAG TPA: Clp protease N-terminal domain-containing protein [Acidimicrobiales bacterium]|nr:Clp protease N-terminal domain-containing protein [Acidimicrobiales bacterium]